MFVPCCARRVTQQRLEALGPRRGAIVPLTALLLVVLVGMLAFAIDLSYASEVESELQNVADAAALAGAGKLQELFVQYNSPGQTNQSQIVATATGTGAGSPTKTAQKVASLNKAGGVTARGCRLRARRIGNFLAPQHAPADRIGTAG